MAETSPLTFRNYLTFWSGQLVSLLGSAIVQFTIIWWVNIEYESALYLGIASFLGMGTFVLFAPFAGVLVDRWNKKLIIGTVDFLQSLITIVLILLFMFEVQQLWHVFLILGIRGVFQGFHTPSIRALIPHMVPEEKLSRMNGVNFLFTGAVNLIGPLVGAVLVESLSEIQNIFWIDVGTFLFAIIPLIIIKIPALEKAKDKPPSFVREFKEGFSYIKSKNGLLSLLLLATLLNFLITPIPTLAPYYVKFKHLGSATDLAFVLAFFQGGIIAGGLLMSFLKGFKKKILVTFVSIYIGFVGYTLITFAPWGSFWVLWIGAVIFGAVMPIINVTTQTIFQTVVPLKMQGRFQAVAFSLSVAAMPAGMLLSGVISEFIGIRIFLSICIGVGVLYTTISWFFTKVRHVEEMEEEIPTL